MPSKGKRSAAYGINTQLMPIGLRRCCSCTEIYPLSAFDEAWSQHGGYLGVCHRCHLRQQNDRRYRGREEDMIVAAVRDDNRRRTDGLRRCVTCWNVAPVDQFAPQSSNMTHRCRTCTGRQFADPDRRARQLLNRELDRLGKKLCKSCREIKFQSEFYRASNGYGWQTECKHCFNRREKCKRDAKRDDAVAVAA